MPTEKKSGIGMRIKSLFLGKNIGNIVTIVVIILMFVIAVYVLKIATEQLKQISQTRFNSVVESSMFQLSRRYESATTALKSARGLFYGSDNVSQDEFNNFVESSEFSRIFPNFGSIGYIPRVRNTDKELFLTLVKTPTESGGIGLNDYVIKPDSLSDEYWPILYVYPDQNASIIGNDMRAESVRRENVERARDIGDASISNGIILGSSGKAGAILVVPMYSTKNIPTTIEDRRDLFSGVMAVSFNYDDFPLGSMLSSVLDKYRINVSISSYNDPAIPFLVTSEKKSFYDRLFGQLKLEEKLVINSSGDYVNVIFEASAVDLLSGFERIEPGIIAVAMILVTGLFCLVIQFLLKLRTSLELNNRYQFVRTLSHQLRTPLTAARWSIESLSTKNKQPTKKSINDALISVKILISIVNEMMYFLEWSETKKSSEQENKITASDLIAAAIRSLPPLHDLKRVKITYGNTKELLILADIRKLSTAIMFLIDNALSYSPVDTDVIIKVTSKDNKIFIEIIDHGFGIPENEQLLVWDYFYRGTNASLGKNSGTGIGLPLSKIIIESYNGTVNFTSDIKSGTNFVVSLPIVD